MKKTEASNHHDKKCGEFFAVLSEYIDDELNEELCRKIESHLVDCECCNTCLATLEKTIELCRSYENIPVPEALSAKLRKGDKWQSTPLA